MVKMPLNEVSNDEIDKESHNNETSPPRNKMRSNEISENGNQEEGNDSLPST